MARPAKPLALIDPEPAAHLHRRRQRVVVRARSARVDLDDPSERREHLPTLSGLGFRDEADTLPALDVPEETVPPISHVRARVAPRIPKAARTFILPPRVRQETLRADIDDDMCERYREEAERILQSGLFDPTDDVE